MKAYPNCKINLGLRIVGRRPDGYHDLQTVFLPVADLCDELEITPLPAAEHAPRMVLEGLALDGEADDNLCLRAWRLMHDECGVPPVGIRLRKNIPFGAGLGGGSSDAAFTLRMLDAMFSLGLGTARLRVLAARLGADCPFFIANRPAYATGIGDQLEPLDDLEIQKSKFKILIEIPDGEHVSTREAYAGLRLGTAHSGCGTTPPHDLREAIRRPVGEWRTLIVNDFEASVFPAHPAIAALKADMYRCGALYASMTGSGAAVFGIFKNDQQP